MTISRAQNLAAAFAEVATTSLGSVELPGFLHLVTRRCVELFDVDAACLLLADPEGTLRPAATTASPVQAAGLVRVFARCGSGPHQRVLHTGAPLPNHDLTAPDRGGQMFGDASAALGFATCHVLPFRSDHHAIGVVGLFLDRRAEAGVDELAWIQGLLDVAASNLAHARQLQAVRSLAEQLQTALDSRVLVEQAKGALSVTAGISVPEAFERIRSHARRSRRTVGEVAEAILTGAICPEALLTSSSDTR